MSDLENTLRIKEFLRQVNNSFNSYFNPKEFIIKDFIPPLENKMVAGRPFVKKFKIDHQRTKRLFEGNITYYQLNSYTMENTGPVNIFPVRLVDSLYVFRGKAINIFPVRLDYSPNTFKSFAISSFPVKLSSQGIGPTTDVFINKNLNIFPVKLVRS